MIVVGQLPGLAYKGPIGENNLGDLEMLEMLEMVGVQNNELGISIKLGDVGVVLAFLMFFIVFLGF